MNTTNDDNLKTAAEAGNINLLYSVIQNDPSVLKRIDEIPFVETPLHIAASKEASKEHLQFATEVMMLKPSLAWKLNQKGYSPIHLPMQNLNSLAIEMQNLKSLARQNNLGMRNNLEMQMQNNLAMQKNQKRMVLRFVDINSDLVRIKGREGLTPLHLASQAGETDLLAEFLSACPESIQDVTVRRETALHIAVKNKQYEALQFLVSWLKRNTRRGAGELEYTILNWKNEAGNTILHVSAQNNQSQALQFLLKTRMINLKAKNLENKTALDIAGDTEIESILSRAGAKTGSQVTDWTPAGQLRLIIEKIAIVIVRIRRDMSDEQRSALLVVATLIVTTTYQSALTPPGGVYQISAGEYNVNTTSLNSTTAAIPRNVGMSIMPTEDFIIFSIFNMVPLFLSTVAICILAIGRGILETVMCVSVQCLICSYFLSMQFISPTPFSYGVCLMTLCIIFALGDLITMLCP